MRIRIFTLREKSSITASQPLRFVLIVVRVQACTGVKFGMVVVYRTKQSFTQRKNISFCYAISAFSDKFLVTVYKITPIAKFCCTIAVFSALNTVS